MITSQIIAKLESAGKIKSGKYVSLTNKEQSHLLQISDTNDFFKSINNTYQKHNQITIKQYICLLNNINNQKSQIDFSTEIPEFQIKQQLLIRGIIIQLKEIYFTNTKQEYYRTITFQDSFYVLEVIGDDKLLYNISISAKNFNKYEKFLIKDQTIQLEAKFKKIYKNAICVNYAKQFNFN